MANGTQTVVMKYWPLITALVVLAAGYGTNTANLANAESAIEDVEQRVAAIETDLGEIKTSQARSEANQEHTTKDIEKIEVMLRDLVQSLDGE
jgi:predicted  nucleic acid-binding Zn-ribbon protein